MESPKQWRTFAEASAKPWKQMFYIDHKFLMNNIMCLDKIISTFWAIKPCVQVLSTGLYTQHQMSLRTCEQHLQLEVLWGKVGNVPRQAVSIFELQVLCSSWRIMIKIVCCCVCGITSCMLLCWELQILVLQPAKGYFWSLLPTRQQFPSIVLVDIWKSSNFVQITASKLDI